MRHARRFIIAAALAVGGGGMFASSAAVAQTAFAPEQTGTFLVTDYAAYPDTLQTGTGPGCDGGGVFGAVYSLNGGAPVLHPRLLPEFEAGDEITMSWDSTTPQCVGAPVVLDIKIADVPDFDLNRDQTAFTPYSEVIATGGEQSISFVFPPLFGEGKACAYQFDAIVGRPLAVVGPSGSDYSSSVRGDDKRTMIVGYEGYRNGAYGECEAEQTTTTTAVEPTTTTTALPASTTTAPPPETTMPIAEQPTTTTAAPAETTVVTAAPAAESSQTVARQPLPNTGPNGPALPILGSSAIIVGLGALAVARRRSA